MVDPAGERRVCTPSAQGSVDSASVWYFDETVEEKGSRCLINYFFSF